MTEVVGYVQYDAEDLVECIRRRSEQTLQEKQITLQDLSVLQTYEQSLSRYTYFCLTAGVRCRVRVSVLYLSLTLTLTPNFPVIPTILLSLAALLSAGMVAPAGHR